MIDRWAQIDETWTYRYTLGRIWSEETPPVLFVLLNPSTADAEKDDPTIRRCMAFARSWGHGGIVVANLFAFRATDPHALVFADDPIGPENDGVLCRESERAGLIVAGWGFRGTLLGRDTDVREMLRGRLYHLGLTQQGQPRHPLYLLSSAKPERLD